MPKLAEDAQKAIDGYEENAVPPAAVTPGIQPTESVPAAGNAAGRRRSGWRCRDTRKSRLQNDDGDGTAGNNGRTVIITAGTVDNNGGTVDNNGGRWIITAETTGK